MRMSQGGLGDPWRSRDLSENGWCLGSFVGEARPLKQQQSFITFLDGLQADLCGLLSTQQQMS